MITPSWVLFSLVLGALALPREHVHTDAEAVQRVHILHRIRQVISNDGFDVLHHLSGNSPYFNSPGVGLDAALPHGCSVVAATYLVRHSDIYANDFEYEDTIAPFLYKLGNMTDRSSFASDPSMAFLTNWTSPIDDPTNQIEKVTDTGKMDAAALGALFARRYQDLLSVNGSLPFRFWTADASRDQDTSKAFISSFNSSFANADLVVVNEGEAQAANTLTPHESCDSFDTTVGSDEEKTFINTYAPAVAARLNGLAAPSFNWTSSDVFAAQTLCGYDVVIRNYSSPFCSLFSESEWLSWEYANDLMYHRSLGYGNALAPTLGMPWVSASARLLSGSGDTTHANSSAGHQSLFVSFTHREEPPFIVTALGLFNTSNASMPANTLNYDRAWRTSDILPFLANIGLERMQCAEPAVSTNTSGTYVRALVNNASIPLPGCASGPGASCALADFQAFVADREKQYGNFVGACGLNDTNATSTLGIYEGVLPADGAAVQVLSIALNGSSPEGNGTKSAVKSSGIRGMQLALTWVMLPVIGAGLAVML